MSTVPSYFKDFLSNIRLSTNQVNDLKSGHMTLRRRIRRQTKHYRILLLALFYRGVIVVLQRSNQKMEINQMLILLL